MGLSMFSMNAYSHHNDKVAFIVSSIIKCLCLFSNDDSAVHYCDSFVEVMNEIEA